MRRLIEKSKIYKEKGNMYNQAITLISLVITIIILIILAGVAINLSLGENGIFRRTKIAKEQYKEAQAREKLETVLAEAVIEKETKENYNNKEFLDNMLEENGIEVNGDIVTVDNYNFTIDRENLKILTENGESNIKLTKEVKSYKGKNENGKYEVEVLLTVESSNEIKTVTIENPDGTTLEIEANKVKLEKDLTIELDEEYKVIVITEGGKTNTRNIIEKSEETIRTALELAELRDKVASGLTYEGKTIKLGNDIDLGSICGENVNGEEISWISRGEFKGNFDGNNYTISNIYIKSNSSYIGLFGAINGATIKNIIIDNSIIEGSHTVGIIGVSSYSTIENIHTTKNNVIKATGGDNGAQVGGIVGATVVTTISRVSNSATVIGNGYYVGGIAGLLQFESSINESYNTGNISAYDNKSNIAFIGGIIGCNYENAEISNCYNIGNVEGYNMIGGIAGGPHNTNPMLTINNCYNIGTIKGTKNVGEIISATNVSNRKINNSYAKTQTITASKLGNSYIDDEKNEHGTWKYNNGYPILKWQIK